MLHKSRKKDLFARARKAMVDTQLLPRGIRQKEVIDAMLTVPRHLFVEEGLREQAYSDFPLRIGAGQTISQPYIVAYMTEQLELSGGEKILEIGTGSGYQAAVLSHLATRIFSVERISDIAARTRKLLDSLHYTNVVIRVGDGTQGWAEHAPYDAIIVTAASPEIPPALIDQLADGGRLIVPVGPEHTQELTRIRKTKGRIVKETLGGCRFVKLIGKNGWQG